MSDIYTCDCEYASCVVVLKVGGPPDTCALYKDCNEVNFVKSG